MKAIQTCIKVTSILLALLVAGCEKGPQEVPLKRDTDAIELTYNEGASNRISVRYNGQWSTRIECADEAGNPVENWFSATPSEGSGNGDEYQWVELTAQRNPGDRRSGVLYLISGGNEYPVTVTQADGHFSIEDPVITGTLKSGTTSGAVLSITWDKAFGGEEITVTSLLSGASEGLEIEEEYSTVIEQEGSGSISIPITGTPAALGELICSVTLTMDGEKVYEGDLSASVSSSNEIFSMGFDLFIWGGNYPENKAGIGPNGSKGADKTFVGTEPANGTITAGSDGTNDVFKTMTEEYRVNRGVSDWEGERVYEHPGYVKLGVTANGGWIMTPELSGLSAAPEQVVVSIDFLRFDNENGTYIVSAEGAGSVVGGVVDSSVLPAQTSSSDREWKTLSFVVNDATNKTRIRIEAEQMGLTGYRMNIDNITVMGADQIEITEQLPAPDPEKITYTPAENSIAFAWEGIEGATGYEVSIAMESAPDFKKTDTTPNADYTFTDLQPGYYLFTIKALYEPVQGFNSEETVIRTGTLGYAVEKLATPENFTASDMSATGAKVTWSAVSGCSYYRVTAKTADGTQAETAVVSETEYTFTKLQSGQTYTATVKALTGDGSVESEFDSDEASVEFTTLDPVPLSKPSVEIYHTSYGLAVVSFKFDESQQADTKFSIRLADGSGTVIREYTEWSFNKKYTLHGTRFLFGGLDPNTTYSASVQRISLDEGIWTDSEWSDPLTFTTSSEPDKSGYLLWNDFDSHPWGGNGPMLAFGIDPKDKDGEFDVENWKESTSWAIASPVKNMDNLGNGVGKDDANKKLYHDLYMPEWDHDELAKNDKNSATGSVYLCGGMMKFGTGSSLGRLTLPAFSGLSGSNLEVSFNACPYCEPNGTTGSLETSPDQYDGVTFTVEILSGPGTIATADGQQVNSTSVTLTNKTLAEMGAEADGRYEMTPHTVTVSGATQETRISIVTENSDGNRRMWLDDLKVRQL